MRGVLTTHEGLMFAYQGLPLVMCDGRCPVENTPSIAMQRSEKHWLLHHPLPHQQASHCGMSHTLVLVGHAVGLLVVCRGTTVD